MIEDEALLLRELDVSVANRLRGRIYNCKQYLEHLKSTAFEGLPH